MDFQYKRITERDKEYESNDFDKTAYASLYERLQYLENKIEDGYIFLTEFKSGNLASDTQKAYKEDYIKSIEETEAEIEILKIQNKNLEIAFDRLEAENERLTEKLKQVLLSIDTVKEMNAMCTIYEHRKQAVKEFAEKLKKKLFEFFQDNEELDGKISVGTLDVDIIGVEAEDGNIKSLGLIDELLKEYEK